MDVRALILMLPALLLVAGPAAAECGAAAPTVARSQFATKVDGREPGRRPAFAAPEDQRLFYFTEIHGGAPEGIVHRWLLDGEALADVPLRVDSQRWRTWSSFQVEDLPGGSLEVRVLDAGGCLLDRGRIEFVAAVAEQPPAEPEQQPEQQPAREAGATGQVPGVAPAAAGPAPAAAVDVAAVLERARRARHAGELDAARQQLDAALAEVNETHADYRALRDERAFHLALAQAREQLKQGELGAMERTLDGVETYLRRRGTSQPAFRRLLDSHRLALRRAQLQR